MSKSAAKERPFVDFYMQHGVIPTRQDISNLRKHFQRRSALYRCLGLVPSHVGGLSVIEFGPGTGQNAVHTLSLHPKRFVLVDANKPSLESTAKMVALHNVGGTDCQVVDREIEKFSTAERFDLALCEGVIPTQDDPARFTRKIAGFLKPGGVLVLTCMDPVSVLPEVLRRYLARLAVPVELPFPERVRRLTAYFRPDLDALPGMSRKREDWVIDNIIHPWSGRLYSMADAMEAMRGKGIPQGSSPRFLTDWRWYKTIHGPARFDLRRPLQDYHAYVHSFLDHRSEPSPQSGKENAALLRLCAAIYHRVFDAERGGKAYPPAAIARDVRSAAAQVSKSIPAAARALDEFAARVGKVAAGRPSGFKHFHKLWGRGQQYISFVVGGE